MEGDTAVQGDLCPLCVWGSAVDGGRVNGGREWSGL